MGFQDHTVLDMIVKSMNSWFVSSVVLCRQRDTALSGHGHCLHICRQDWRLGNFSHHWHYVHFPSEPSSGWRKDCWSAQTVQLGDFLFLMVSFWWQIWHEFVCTALPAGKGYRQSLLLVRQLFYVFYASLSPQIFLASPAWQWQPFHSFTFLFNAGIAVCISISRDIMLIAQSGCWKQCAVVLRYAPSMLLIARLKPAWFQDWVVRGLVLVSTSEVSMTMDMLPTLWKLNRCQKLRKCVYFSDSQQSYCFNSTMLGFSVHFELWCSTIFWK